MSINVYITKKKKMIAESRKNNSFTLKIPRDILINEIQNTNNMKSQNKTHVIPL